MRRPRSDWSTPSKAGTGWPPTRFWMPPSICRDKDRANAYYYGGIAQQKMGRWPQARNNLSLAISNSRDPDFRAKAIAQLKVTGYTLQTGAYEIEDHARSVANTMANRVASMHMGRPRIVPSHDPGSNRRLYLVQVGEFSSWPTALAARDELGLSGFSRGAAVDAVGDFPPLPSGERVASTPAG